MRNKYDLNFKRMVVAKGRELGNITEAARQYNLAPNMVFRWAKQLECRNLDSWNYRTARLLAFVPTEKEYAALKKENKRLKMLYAELALECEILRDGLKRSARTCG